MVMFYSLELQRQVDFDEVEKLDAQELRGFHKELVEVIASLDTAIKSFKEKQQASGVETSPDWLHRAATKKRIALKFANEVHSQMNGGTSVKQRLEYERMYKTRFRAFLEKEFGKQELIEIERELIQATKREYKAWIDSTGQSVWFSP